MADIARLSIEVRVSGVDRANSELGDLAENAERAGDASDRLNRRLRDFSAVNSQIRQIGQDLTRGITLPIVAAATAATTFANDLNEGLAQTQSLLAGTFQENTQRIMEFRDAVLDASSATGRGFNDLSEGLYESISAFQDGEDAIDQFNTAVNLAVAGGSQTREAIGLLSAVTKAYGNTTAAAQEQVANFAISTVRLGQTTFPALAASDRKSVV